MKTTGLREGAKNEVQRVLSQKMLVRCYAEARGDDTFPTALHINIWNRDVVRAGMVFGLQYTYHPFQGTLEIRGGDMIWNTGAESWYPCVFREPHDPESTRTVLCDDNFVEIVVFSMTAEEMLRGNLDIDRLGIGNDRAFFGHGWMSLNSPFLLSHYARLHQRIYCELLLMTGSDSCRRDEWHSAAENLAEVYNRLGAFIERRQDDWRKMGCL